MRKAFDDVRTRAVAAAFRILAGAGTNQEALMVYRNLKNSISNLGQ
jgi:hypothetical protein